MQNKQPPIDKYAFYQSSTQSPDVHIPLFTSVYQEIRGKAPRRLREDFCGTFLLCCEWVRFHPENTAIGLDLDPEPLTYGRKNNLSQLKPTQKKRVQVFKQDVLKTHTAKLQVSDIVIACNFSFYIFKERQLLLKYFKAVCRSLHSSGVLILEMAGGPGMIHKAKEQKTVKEHGKFVYVWDQKSFDPVTHDAHYSIHFKLPSGKVLKDAFVYDWRLWSIPEVRELLAEAGFTKSLVYWETSHKGKGTGEYAPVENADNDFAWVAYVVGVK